ncbi:MULTISPECIES: ribonuclease P protein component [Sphingobium]|uniref:ribonuclease P protein component n=1 Tax=Sphingobium TaxID=165695 RepID=UPI000A7AA2DA|nr:MULTISPECIES: ribonuclease P protein component [Sphingobium]
MGKRADFLAANRGRRAPMPGFVLLVRERGDGDPAMRYGITVTKKIGGAVVRNRMKRRFRVLARELLPLHGVAGADHVLIGRSEGIERDFGLLRAEMAKALGKVMSRPAGDTRGRPGKKAAHPKSDVLLRRQEPSSEAETKGNGGTGFLPVQEHGAEKP